MSAVEEKRLSDDGQYYTLKEFITFCGEEDGKWYWSQAKPEKRISDDGQAYTLQEFIGFCGEEDGKWYWSQAKPANGKVATPTPAASKTLSAPTANRPRSASPAPMPSSGCLEKDVTAWVEAVTGERKGGATLMGWLKDGQVLCRMANQIQPGICPRINTQSMPFKQMENVTAFIQAARKLGVLEKDVFSTVDLYEEKNPQSVLMCIYSLGGAVQRTAPQFQGPFLGVARNAAVSDYAREKQTVTQSSGYRADIQDEVRDGFKSYNQTARPWTMGAAATGSRTASRSPAPSPRGAAAAPSNNLSTPAANRTPSRSPAPSPRAASNNLSAPAANRQRSASPTPMPSSGNLEQDVTAWVEAVTGERKGGATLMGWLKDGQVLCRMANKIHPGICPRINTQSMPFKQMENVTAFIQAARKLGVLEKDVFSTVDLYEEKNPQSVVMCIYNFGGAVQRTAPDFQGPYLGKAQNTSVKDSAREKTTVTQGSGFRTDISNEVRAGVSRGRHM